jgi:hypothetical protein
MDRPRTRKDFQLSDAGPRPKKDFVPLDRPRPSAAIKTMDGPRPKKDFAAPNKAGKAKPRRSDQPLTRG